jgi:hypothetical protein
MPQAARPRPPAPPGAAPWSAQPPHPPTAQVPPGQVTTTSAGPAAPSQPPPTAGRAWPAAQGWPTSAPSVPQQSGPAPWSYPPAPQGPPAGYGAAPLSNRQVQPDLYRSARIPAPTAPPQRRRRGPWAALAVLIVIVALFAAGFFAYRLISQHNTGSGSTGTGSSSTAPPHRGTSSQPTQAGTRSPQSVVVGYFRAINRHHYLLAWHLGGRNISHAPSFAAFRHGFAGTAHDAVQILAVDGNIVSCKLAATQTNGTVKNFEGTYTVVGGAIVESHITPVS